MARGKCLSLEEARELELQGYAVGAPLPPLSAEGRKEFGETVKRLGALDEAAT